MSSLIAADEILPLAWSGPGGFLEWFKRRWAQGEHLNVAAPTGAGKTTFCTGVLEHCRNYVAGVDAKGGDRTLADTGWPRITGQKDRFGQWLPYEYRKKIRDGEPVRIIVGRRAANFADLRKNWQRQSALLEAIFVDGKWTLYLPDLQLLTDPGLGNIKVNANMMWIAARDRYVSLVTDMQEFSWTPRLARSMPRWFVAGYTRNLDSVQAMAVSAGRSNAEVRGMIAALKQREFSWLVFSNNPRDPIVVTVPDERKPPARAASTPGGRQTR
jgi:hypothetical protein